MASLDAEELFHLALKASETGDHDKAINYLKESIEKDPTANAYYILAAEHAEIGMMDRAIDGMEQAVAINPELWTAHFQLGLLLLTQNLADRAVEALKPLSQLPEEDALYHFGEGLTLLIDGDIENCKTSLAKGVSLNEINPALNNDIERILSNLNNADSPEQELAEEVESTDAGGNHFFLSNYDKDTEQ